MSCSHAGFISTISLNLTRQLVPSMHRVGSVVKLLQHSRQPTTLQLVADLKRHVCVYVHTGLDFQ